MWTLEGNWVKALWRVWVLSVQQFCQSKIIQNGKFIFKHLEGNITICWVPVTCFVFPGIASAGPVMLGNYSPAMCLTSTLSSQCLLSSSSQTSAHLSYLVSLTGMSHNHTSFSGIRLIADLLAPSPKTCSIPDCIECSIERRPDNTLFLSVAVCALRGV